MATEVKMPKLGIDMTEGAITKWIKAEGESVKAEEPIAEVETDKSTVDMTAPADGVLIRIVVAENDLVPVGTVVAFIGEAGEQVPGGNGATPATDEAEHSQQAGPGESLPDAQAAPAKPATQDTAPAQAGTTQTQSRPAAPQNNRTSVSAADVKASPVARRLADEEGIDLSKVKGTGPGGRITKEDVELALVTLMDAEPTPPDGVKASPAARRMAREKGYTISEISGTGPGGRVVVQDILNFAPAKATPAQTPVPPQPAVPVQRVTPTAAPTESPVPAPLAAEANVQGIGQAEEIPLSRMRRRITQVLTASKAPVPHFYVTMDIDMAAASALRDQMNATLAEEGIKVSYNDLVVKATALALKKFPNLNASFAGDKIIHHGDINVGIAVSTPTGLLTVATRHTDRLALSEMSVHIKASAGRARDGKVQPDDLGGTTFTVSNLGMYGVDSFVAIITPPEAGVIAVGGIRQEPVVKDGVIVAGSRMRLTLSADHRVTDGAEGAEFMVEIKRLLENPMRLML